MTRFWIIQNTKSKKLRVFPKTVLPSPPLRNGIVLGSNRACWVHFEHVWCDLQKHEQFSICFARKSKKCRVFCVFKKLAFCAFTKNADIYRHWLRRHAKRCVFLQFLKSACSNFRGKHERFQRTTSSRSGKTRAFEIGFLPKLQKRCIYCKPFYMHPNCDRPKTNPKPIEGLSI